MHEQYTSPELTLVGNAEAVVFGSLGVGDDIWDQYQTTESEFQADLDFSTRRQ